ncbi:Lar family restriction alleviation protein [Agrobacterium sp. S7/73]|uniref:Lar family restriction alleviation protein n=1 Tax=Agrobacterium sp. S7/73 TaxID=2820002 RepID=UPI001C5B0F78|nr:Lar family restriction alleviation protein [Agrobacterium sp. S7/73]QXZ71844.1 hypothetical protein J5276_12195 [Agrobacterium sp. S7/73]QXZ74632.1 hypothetical protein J5276_18810 [Agrobacterium sp. S7/73]
MSTISLLPCPFCGGEATVQPWHGGRPTKKLIRCSNGDHYDEDGGCSVGPSVCGETEEEAAAAWNRRATDENKLTPEEAWTYLCETPDITSPEEYPDHALITLEQLRDYMWQAAKPAGAALPMEQPSTVVTRQEALDFLGIATRNWSDMPSLCEDDIGDLATGLSWFTAKKAELGKIEANLKSLVIAHPEKALLAALDDDTHMWFVAQLTTIASASVPLTEIEAMVLRHLAPALVGGVRQ